MRLFRRSWVGIAIALAGCGGGGGGNPAPPPPAPTFTVGVTVSGLAGTGLVLRNNGGNPLTVAASGASTFSTALTNGAQYVVTVDTQPSNPSQTCTVTGGTGTIVSANVTSIAVACTTNRYTVGGTVTGLAGSGLLLLQGSEDLAINADGGFTFPTDVISGGSFNVRVLRHPAAPNQYCRVTGGTGSVTNAAITSISIACVSHVPRFAYSMDYDSASVSIYGIDASTGQLRPRGHVRTGLNPIMAFSDEQQRFWFVLNQGDATISVFEQDPVTAALTEVAGSPYATAGTGGGEDVGPTNLVVHSSGKFVYVVNGAGTDTVAAFAVNATNGTLTHVTGSPFAVGSDPFWMTIDRAGRFAYVTHRGSDDIYVLSIDSVTGALTELAQSSRVTTGEDPGVLSFHDSGRFAYVPNMADDDIMAFSVDANTGTLTPISGSPFAAGTNPSIGALIHPSGKYLYLRNAGAPDGAGTVSAFTIDQTSGALAPISAAAAIGENSTRAVMDPAGRFLFIANRGAPLAGNPVGSVSLFRIDQATGSLQALPGLPPSILPLSMVNVDASGKYVYVTDVRTDSHIAFELDETTGTLNAVPGAFVRGRRQPVVLGVYSSVRSPAAATFRSKFAYVPNATDSSIGAFAIDSSSGALTSVSSIASAGPTPRSAAVHPSGRFLLASHEGGAPVGIASYPLDITTGALSASVSSFFTGGTPGKVLASPNGRNVYVLNAPSNLVQGFAIDAAGALTQVPPFNGINTVQPAKDIAIAPNNRFLHFITDDGWGRDRFDENGGFTGTGSTTGLTAGKTALVIDPQGLFAYVAVAGDPAGAIEMFTLAPNPLLQAALLFQSSTPTGASPVAVAVDPTGRFVYTANSGSHDISTFAVNHLAGTLTELSPRVAAGTNPASIAADYSGKFLYVLSRGTNQVLTYSIDSATGALTASGAAPATTGVGPHQIVVSADME